MYNIYSIFNTSLHHIITRSILHHLSLSLHHHHRIAAASQAPVTHDWLPGLGFAN